jgi:hypothetical protein
MMSAAPLAKLTAFLERLDEARIPYTLHHSRDNAVMVCAFAPGEYWEIEFMDDGEIDIERYVSNGKIDDESVLEELFAKWSEKEATPEEEDHHDATARK